MIRIGLETKKNGSLEDMINKAIESKKENEKREKDDMYETHTTIRVDLFERNRNSGNLFWQEWEKDKESIKKLLENKGLKLEKRSDGEWILV